MSAPPSVNGASPPSSAEPAVPNGESLPATQNPAAVRPEGLPEQFWDEKAGFKQKEFIEDYNNLAKFKTDQDKVLGEIPKEPAGYVLGDNLVPEELAKELPAGAEVTLDENSPLLLGARDILHKHQASPALFQELGKLVIGEQLKAHIASEKAHADFVSAEDAKLGGNAVARKAAVSGFLKGHLGEEIAKAFSFDGPSRNATSAQIEALEKLAQKFSTQGNVVPLQQKREDTPPPPAPKPLAERKMAEHG
ncbi:MAG: hypothetical protein IPK23_15085 [Rhizobiales bacterium]|nr:hypothetical protein [Hyphomicrobiales bacterium]